MNNPEAVEWLERDYDQIKLFPPYQMGEGLVSVRASGWQPGANVVRPMIEIINDAPCIPLGSPAP